MFYEGFARRVWQLYDGSLHVIVSGLASHSKVLLARVDTLCRV